MYIKADENGVLTGFLGLIFEKVTCVKDDPKNYDEIVFHLNEKVFFKMSHEQDCCESVTIEDICGELDWLVGSPILRAEERTNSNENDDYPASETYTFYEFSTLKGSVTIRWHGTSNGYYSESVDIEKYELNP